VLFKSNQSMQLHVMRGKHLYHFLATETNGASLGVSPPLSVAAALYALREPFITWTRTTFPPSGTQTRIHIRTHIHRLRMYHTCLSLCTVYECMYVCMLYVRIYLFSILSIYFWNTSYSFSKVAQHVSTTVRKSTPPPSFQSGIPLFYLCPTNW
jgi:hypothetical protein